MIKRPSAVSFVVISFLLPYRFGLMGVSYAMKLLLKGNLKRKVVFI